MAAPQLAEPKSKVEIRVSCKDLLDKDLTSKSDPLCALYMQKSGAWYEIARTECIKNSLNPDFATPFIVDYFFEEVQNIRLSVYDLDNATDTLSDDDFLGEWEGTLGEVVSECPFVKPLKLRNKKPAGKSTIKVEGNELKADGMNVLMHLTLKASKLDNKDFMGKSDPYLEILRQTDSGGWQLITRTEVIKNNLNPVWRPMMLTMQQLCRNNPEAPIKLDVYDWDSDGSHDFIGSCQATAAQMQKASAASMVEWPLINPKKQAKKKSYKNSGILQLANCRVETLHTFLDFILGGLQLNCTIGIDFTASNGKPDNPQSLHYINPYQPNEYERAIRSVGAVIRDYDSDKMFPVLGFGARLPPAFEVAVHEFAVNFQPQNPFCQDIEGVEQAYKNCIRQVQLYGPTNFSPILYHVARFAEQAHADREPKNYFILLIITDGVISDMAETVSALVHCSALPMSVIIVGVGSADFSAMDTLDGDEGVLRDRQGRVAHRDIVQFVPFRKFMQMPASELARHVLAEIPKQVTDYFKSKNMPPNPPRQVAPSL